MTSEQIELDIRAAQIEMLTKERDRLLVDLEFSQGALRVADSELVKAKVKLSDILWGLSGIQLAEVKFEKAKGKGWRFIRGERDE